jgi:hypothetical protein
MLMLTINAMILLVLKCASHHYTDSHEHVLFQAAPRATIPATNARAKASHATAPDARG